MASSGGKRYCRVNAGCHLAAGDPAGYDQDPADGEPPRAETDCRGSGIHDCPCEADGPDGLCACCRRGDQNGSCRYARMTAKRRAEHHPCALEEAGWNEPTIHEAVKAGLLAAVPAIKRDVSRAIAEEVLTLAAEDRRRTRNVGPYRDMRTSLRKLARGDPLPDPRDLRGGSDG